MCEIVVLQSFCRRQTAKQAGPERTHSFFLPRPDLAPVFTLRPRFCPGFTPLAPVWRHFPGFALGSAQDFPLLPQDSLQTHSLALLGPRILSFCSFRPGFAVFCPRMAPNFTLWPRTLPAPARFHPLTTSLEKVLRIQLHLLEPRTTGPRNKSRLVSVSETCRICQLVVGMEWLRHSPVMVVVALVESSFAGFSSNCV